MDSEKFGNNPLLFPGHSSGHVYTVTQFTLEIKSVLESAYPFIWIKGEVSNFRKAASGHFYFTLKDDAAQINAVMFRNQNRHLKFKPENGIMLIGFGRINVFEPRGTYQIIFEYLEPEGIGAIILAFEQLKSRLESEGLFKAEFKKPLPFLPKKISIITSPTGAVIHDMIHIISRRFPNLHIEVVPVKVQGEGAENDIISALNLLNSRHDSADETDIIVLARGGGSLEDMHAFNAENVARSVFSSRIPVISAIGHETDYTITDFVADLRAPTPSAAAEIVVPVKKEIQERCNHLRKYLYSAFYSQVLAMTDRLKQYSKRLFYQETKINDLRLRLEDFLSRMIRLALYAIQKDRDALKMQIRMLMKNHPSARETILKDQLNKTHLNLMISMNNNMREKVLICQRLTEMLNSLSPTSTLERGYSITRTIPGQEIVRDSETVKQDQELEIILAKGRMKVKRLKG